MADRRPPRALRTPRITRRAAAFLVVGAVAGLVVTAWGALAASRPVPPVSFVTYAAGTVRDDTPLWSVPGGGTVMGQVAGGSRVGVGGTAVLSAGLARADAYWIAVPSPGGLLHGFVPASVVDIVAGRVPRLDLHGVRLADLAGGRAPVEAAAAVAPDATLDIPWLPAALRQWEPLFVAAGAEHGVDPALLAIITLVESGGQPLAVSTAGAQGLMQIMPATASDIARWRGLGDEAPADLSEPGVNIDFGAYYVARLLGQFGTLDDPDWARSVELAAAAYNGGPGAAQRWLQGGTLPDETEAYRRFVSGMWAERKDATSPTFAAWCRAGGLALVPPPDCPAG